MKTILKRTLLTIASIVILFGALMLYQYLPMLFMKPAATGQITGTNIFAVKNVFNTVFFIKTDSGLIMIDSGSDAPKLENSIHEAGISPNDVKWIFLTHSDYDHVAGLPLFPNADIFMSEDELPLINGTVKRTVLGGNAIPPGIDAGKIKLLSEGQKFLLNGRTVTCIKAPGHTPGSMVYMIDGQFLFSGDMFKVRNAKISVHPFTMDAKSAGQTIAQLEGIIRGSSMVLTAHYGYFEGKNIR